MNVQKQSSLMNINKYEGSKTIHQSVFPHTEISTYTQVRTTGGGTICCRIVKNTIYLKYIGYSEQLFIRSQVPKTLCLN